MQQWRTWSFLPSSGLEGACLDKELPGRLFLLGGGTGAAADSPFGGNGGRNTVSVGCK